MWMGFFHFLHHMDYQAVALSASFFAALLGAVTSSVVTGKSCAKKVPKDVNLKIVQ